MTANTLIIGSGVVATAISQKLLQKNPKEDILILEAGTKVKMQDYGLWANYLISGKLPYDPYKDLDYPERDLAGENVSAGGTEIPLAGARVLTCGGSTIHWGGWSLRLKPEDFKLRTNANESIDWPITYDDLEDYYCQAEHYIGVSGDSADTTVPRSAGYPFPPFPFTLEDRPLVQAMSKLGVAYSNLPIARHGITDTASKHAPCQTTGTCKYCPFGARFAAVNFLDEMMDWEDYPNFRIILNAVVESVVMDSKSRAKGVIWRDKGTGRTEMIEAHRIIVAAGTIESAKLLLRSTSEFWPAGVGNGSDLVGRNFITHPYFIFTGTVKSNPQRLQPEMNFPTLMSRHFDSPAEQARGKFVLINPPDSTSINLVTQMQSGVSREQLDQNIVGRNKVQLHGMVEVFSRNYNRVTNLDKLNRLGMLETVVDFTKDPGFDRRMAEIQGHVTRIFEAMDATIDSKPSISWRADHASCTCRMSNDPSEGVVNPDLRIHGIDNLYVCSNAVFCSTGAVNPTLTVTALALRLGDHLQQQGNG